MAVLDIILVKEIVNTPTSVVADYRSEIIDLTWREGEFAIQVDYDSGVNVDMVLWLEVSVDGITYVPITDKQQAITDTSGTHIWDIAGSGVAYMRVYIEVNTGSIDIQNISYKGKRRH